MVLSAQTKLLDHIDRHLASYIQHWQLLAQQLNTTDVPHSQQFLTTLATNLQENKRQNLVVSAKQDYAELRLAATPHTLLFYHCYKPETSPLQTLAHVAALLSALDACKNSMDSLPINIQWLFDTSNTTTNLEEWAMLAPDSCICYHPAETGVGNAQTPILASGTKGYLRIELEVHTLTSTIGSMHAGIAPDALWRLLWALGTLKDAREDILIEGFYDTLTSVQDDMLAQLRTLPDTTDILTQLWDLPQLLMGLQGFQLHYAHLLLPTCTVSSITHAVAPTSTANMQTETVLPGEAKAQVDFYLVPDQDPQDIFRKLHSHLQKQGFSDVQVRILSASHPLSTAASNPFLQRAFVATEKAYEQKPFLLPTTVGSYTPSAPWMKDGTPIVFMARNELNSEHDAGAFACMVKHIALLIALFIEEITEETLEGTTHGADTTQ
jgi:acetylornithine deacetylase/succinyl-diaminopimelate desuccinylase-like protein